MVLRLFGKSRGNENSENPVVPPKANRQSEGRDAGRSQTNRLAGRGSVLAMREPYRRELDLERFPNDLTRMLFLASLRDCNSGRYLHPQLSQQMGTEAADTVLCACHDDIFRRLVATPMSDYVVQLEEYIRYARADKDIILKAWQSLQAYRSTMPLLAVPIYGELFCLNVEFALTVLQGTWMQQSSGNQEATSF
jgi:hypothetical protein